MKKVLLSACLLGEQVRYDGASKQVLHPVLTRWLAEGRVVRLCPEVAGGLGVPRPPAELQPDGRVRTVEGRDVTSAFETGARLAVELALREGVAVAVMKEGSPSCGSSRIYDGTFSGVSLAGSGLATRALTAAGVRVFNELQLEEADLALRS